jgi:hypothetical protein
VLKARAAGGEAVLHAGLRVRPAGPVTEIAAESDLRAMAYNLSGHFRLTRDIDLSAEDWQPIGSEEYPFTGVLDGGGHEIRGLNAALFGVVRQAEISELILRAPVVGEDGEAAAIAITALDSYIHDAAVLDGIVRGGEAAGCVFRAEGSVLSGLVNFAAVRSEFPSGARPYAAGIAALATNYTLVRHCVNYGNISGGYLVGGITALSAGSDITRCFSGGTVSGSLETALPPPGGIAHLVEWGRLTDCYYLEGESGAAVGAGNLSPAVIAAVTPVNAERAEEAEALTRLGEFAGAEPEWRFRPEWADGPLPAGVAALLPAGGEIEQFSRWENVRRQLHHG